MAACKGVLRSLGLGLRVPCVRSGHPLLLGIVGVENRLFAAVFYVFKACYLSLSS